jgi:hypothetical protein
MTLPPDVEFYKDIGLLVHRPRGSLNKSAVSRIVALVGELEYSLQEPFNRFFDTIEADAVDLNFEYVIRISFYRRCVYGNRPPIKSAILATDATMAHYGRLHALLTQGSPINVRVFQDRREAAQWLGVPLELVKSSDAEAGEDEKEGRGG